MSVNAKGGDFPLGEAEKVGHEVDRKACTNPVMCRQRLNAYRALVRNDLRSFFETVPCLAKIFNVPFIKKYRPADIADEEQELHQRKFHRLLREEKDLHPVRALEFDSFDRDEYKTEEDIKTEEYVKYFGEKLAFYLLKRNYVSARGLMDKTFEKAAKEENTKKIQMVLEMGSFKTADALARESLDQDADKFGERFLNLQSVSDFRKEDIEDLLVNFKDNPELKKSMVGKLVDALKIHPGLYAVMRDRVVVLGFFDEDVDKMPEIRGAIRTELLKLLKSHVSLYFYWKNMLVKLGIVDGEDFKDDPEFRKVMYDYLLGAINRDPKLYFFILEKWKMTGLYDQEVLNADPAVRRVLSMHLHKWKKISSSVYGKFMREWAMAGVIETSLPDDLKRKVEKIYMVEIMAGRAMWDASLNRSLDDAGEFVERVMLSCEDDSRVLIIKEKVMEMKQHDKMSDMADLLNEFAGRYPQYAKVCKNIMADINLLRIKGKTNDE